MAVQRESARTQNETDTRSRETLRPTHAGGEDRYRVFDFPTRDQAKIYYDNATLHLLLSRQEGT